MVRGHGAKALGRHAEVIAKPPAFRCPEQLPMWIVSKHQRMAFRDPSVQSCAERVIDELIAKALAPIRALQVQRVGNVTLADTVSVVATAERLSP